MNLNEKITQLREEKRISRSEMADRLNMSSQSYWNIETGKTELTVSRLHKIAEMLGVSVLELMTGEPQKVEDTGKVEDLMKRGKHFQERAEKLEEIASLIKEDRDRLSAYFLKVVKDWIEPKILHLIKSGSLMPDSSLYQAEKIVESVLLFDDNSKEIIADFPPRIAHLYFWLDSGYHIEDKRDQSKLYELISQKGVKASQAILDFYYTKEQQDELNLVSEEDYAKAMRMEFYSKNKRAYLQSIALNIGEEDFHDEMNAALKITSNWDLKFYRLLKRALEKFPPEAESAFEGKEELFKNKIICSIKFRPDGWREAYLWIADTIKFSRTKDDLLIKQIISSGVIKDKELNAIFK